jgi:uncharacterized protein YndB with AHSA1/START domain
MEASTETGVIEREIAIAASPETIWDFLVDPMKATRWMGTETFFDPRPGGEYRVEVISGETAIGEFVELDRPRRLVFTWGWRNGANGVPEGSSTVDIELVPEDDGTMLRFRHSGLPDAHSTERHAHGWDHYLERLAIVARGDDPGRDTWLDGVT